MKAYEFDEKFDNRDNIIENLDLNSVKRINIDIPIWMIERLDMEALIPSCFQNFKKSPYSHRSFEAVS